MQRSFRLTRSDDIRRVQRSGKSYPHPLLVLVTRASEMPGVRVAVIAGKGVGTAVQRNRAKRLLRAAMGPLATHVAPGWDLVLIARPKLSASDYFATREALTAVLGRAGLMQSS